MAKTPKPKPREYPNTIATVEKILAIEALRKDQRAHFERARKHLTKHDCSVSEALSATATKRKPSILPEVKEIFDKMLAALPEIQRYFPRFIPSRAALLCLAQLAFTYQCQYRASVKPSKPREGENAAVFDSYQKELKELDCLSAILRKRHEQWEKEISQAKAEAFIKEHRDDDSIGRTMILLADEDFEPWQVEERKLANALNVHRINIETYLKINGEMRETATSGMFFDTLKKRIDVSLAPGAHGPVKESFAAFALLAMDKTLQEIDTAQRWTEQERVNIIGDLLKASVPDVLPRTRKSVDRKTEPASALTEAIRAQINKAVRSGADITMTPLSPERAS